MNSSTQNSKLTIREIVLFSLFGGLLFGQKFALELLPNVHLTALFVVALTLVYRAKALYPLYIFVLLDGVREGFAQWWIPYLYIWLPLWAFGMLLPRTMPRKAAIPICMAVCGLHGLAFGTMFAPVWAITAHLSLQGMVRWIAAGLPFDAIHCVNNIVWGALVIPLAELLRKLEKAGKGT